MIPATICERPNGPTHPIGGAMQNLSCKLVWVLIVAAVTILLANTLSAQDLLESKCGELMRMAETYQQDLKAVDTVLGSAIDSGDMDRIKNYKLKKGMIKKQLDSVLKAVELKGCAKTKL